MFHYNHGKIKVYTRHGNEVTYKYLELQYILYKYLFPIVSWTVR
ncbi:hypothetical protein D5F11_009540 [Siminovitchia terrae]|uniref:Uncharacterized protein n=1 Tax=Siminovitchia terrae TaxID=1914933 RepID=A0A429X919_SIMTE|nr:hypothetical protein D5F11_009540 [Siminovitchia terrae]